ncbi:potassium-transporting ATPase subunit F [Paludisphaera mucosa]|uniref:Potassium-transporting ATPase subunit F n=1 Tax=Paludisphaera mucosa TaxID=3030827 RepID=A0ABT6F546_9BACT|nr:potassium-transporting ATPase subunit F [Paludisphaera mucosa]MDG3002639.1 potassium-transporting ATPase subunit F [Paludisphaera mucosa]
MDWMHVVAVVTAAFLAVYLSVALLKPEWFA